MWRFNGIQWRQDVTHTAKTIKKISEYAAAGYTILDGNDWRLSQRKKWANFECVKLSQTNSRRHGKCVSTVWAVRRIER